MEQKFKEMTDIHGNKIELEKYIKINKRSKIYMDKKIYRTSSHTIASLNNFRRVMSHSPKKRIIVFRRAKNHTPFLCDKVCLRLCIYKYVQSRNPSMV